MGLFAPQHSHLDRPKVQLNKACFASKELKPLTSKVGLAITNNLEKEKKGILGSVHAGFWVQGSYVPCVQNTFCTQTLLLPYSIVHRRRNAAPHTSHRTLMLMSHRRIDAGAFFLGD